MQKAKYEEPGEKTRETRSERTGKTKEAKAEMEHRGSHCKAETGRKRKGRNRGRVARTGTEVDERKRIERGEPESESKREALVEQLWERSQEGRKETNRKPSTGIWKEGMRNQAGEKEETEEARAETGVGEATVRQNREEKERKKQKAE